MNDEKTSTKKQLLYIFVGIGAFLIFILSVAFFADGSSNTTLTKEEEEYGRLYAIRDISNGSDYIRENLGCITDSKTSDGIILVKCTDYGNNIRVEYGSNEVWYGYIPTGDGMYSYYIDKDKDVVLSRLR
mgnify:CR=1 FL=1